MSQLPSTSTMYRAFERKDSSYEGVFWLGVRTTGIFCRPTCRARTPKRENVEFFAAPSEALHAGYRPCMKCRPLDSGRKPPPLVAQLLVAVERSPAGAIAMRSCSTWASTRPPRGASSSATAA
jgi:AraC family transcriptional regulator of adaptative response/methylated-DNA-[protein]-cysteine methyltransferase